MEEEAERIYKDERGLLLDDEAASTRDAMWVFKLSILFSYLIDWILQGAIYLNFALPFCFQYLIKRYLLLKVVNMGYANFTMCIILQLRVWCETIDLNFTN